MSSLVGGTGVIGQDMVCGFGNGKYKTFEGTEISIENCVKARVKDLVVEGKTIQDPEDLSNIESVTERENNLVNTTTIYESMLESGTIGSLFNPKSNSVYDVYKMEIQPNTEYLFNLVGYSQAPWVRILDKNNITVKSQNLSSTGLNYIWSLKTESNFYYLVFNKPKTSTGEFKIYKEQNPYPLKLKINEENNYINLPIPLRSLPSGTCDTIEGNTLVQRVGKVILDGSQSINKSTIAYHENVARVQWENTNLKIGRDNSYCDKFPYGNNDNDVQHYKLGSAINTAFFYIPIKYTNNINSYFEENPTTLYYELIEPIIHNITVPQLRTIRGTNEVTCDNNIKPKLKLKVKVKK